VSPRSRGVSLRRWLSPSIGLNRWFALVIVGMVLVALAVAHLLRQLSRDIEPGSVAASLLDIATLQFLPYPLRGLAVGVVGAACIVVGGYRVMRVITDPLRGSDTDQPFVEVLYQRRHLARGPRIVAIGGGTGLSALLRGLKQHTSNLTAIVTVADDGGSSGVLREELGIPPVGDIRNCIVALADAEPQMRELLQYRFPAGDDPDATTLGGHAVGNLLLAAMVAVEGGDFEEGVRRLNRILAVRGQVVPVTATPLTLHARRRNGDVVEGQSRIMVTSDIERVWVTPEDVTPSQDALDAIADAELIILGPGSLYTSLLPSLLVPAIRDAVAVARVPRLFVCNVATQPNETDRMSLAQHLDALVDHTTPGIVDLVLANNRLDATAPADWLAEPVRLDWPPAMTPPPNLVLDDVVASANAHHHDPAKLAAAVIRAYETEAAARRRVMIRSA
jgi:uncharacterized cofD-like protein